MYIENSRRAQHRESFGDIDTYLQSLEMFAQVDCMEGLPFKRSVQLINKSNQFNLTGARISEADAEKRILDENSVERTFRLKDKFGDNGLISVVLGSKNDTALHIDTWVMSCRVLERGMEQFVMKEMAQTALDMGCSELSGVYRYSGRNSLVSDLYKRLGFARRLQNEDEVIWVINANPGNFNSKITEIN